MRAALLVAGAAVVLGVVSAVSAQAPPPTVTVTAGTTTLSVSASSPVPAGPTRFEIVSSGQGQPSVALAGLRRGVSVEEAIAAARRPTPDEVLELVHLDLEATLFEGQERRAVTVVLRPDTTYLVVNTTARRPADWPIQTFTTGQPGNAGAPRPDAAIGMVDVRFRGDTTLPRNGIVRVENAGWAPHFAFALPLRRGASANAVARALRRSDERRLGRLVDFRAQVEVQGLLSRGGVNYNELSFPRRGRYVMACFFENHHEQGMYRFVRVR